MNSGPSHIFKLALPALAALVFATPAHAHVGMAGGANLAGAFLHPFTGLDHVLVLMGVGLWASAGRWQSQLGVLGAAILATAAGGALGAGFGGATFAAPALFAAIIAIGLLILFGQRLPSALGLGLALVAAMLHGHPHGTEIWASLVPGHYALGFLLGSGAVIGLGLMVGMLARRTAPILMQGAAASLAAAGLVFLIG